MLKLGRKILSFRKRIVAIVVGVTMVTLSLLFTNDMDPFSSKYFLSTESDSKLTSMSVRALPMPITRFIRSFSSFGFCGELTWKVSSRDSRNPD